jgi:prevent-host-death family protein
MLTRFADTCGRSRLSLMTKSVGVHEAKSHLSELLRRVAAGEEITITRRGHEIARLVPPARRPQRRLGFDRGRFDIPDDFDEPLPDDTLDAFER